jgi:hypothetical protein
VEADFVKMCFIDVFDEGGGGRFKNVFCFLFDLSSRAE